MGNLVEVDWSHLHSRYLAPATRLAEAVAEESTAPAASVELERVVETGVVILVAVLVSQVLLRLLECSLAPADLVETVVAALVEAHSSDRKSPGLAAQGPVGDSVREQGQGWDSELVGRCAACERRKRTSYSQTGAVFQTGTQCCQL